MNCPACRDGRCGDCPDKVLTLLGKNLVCTCKRTGHMDAINGEPRAQQIEDPFTGDIHAPGAIVEAQTGGVEFKKSSPSTGA